ncbi:unnamed protein product [Urochloa humidicola]
MDGFIKAAEYMEMLVRWSDDEPLQKLFVAVRSELNLVLKNIKTEQAKFWKQHPSLAKSLRASSASIAFLHMSRYELPSGRALGRPRRSTESRVAYMCI